MPDRARCRCEGSVGEVLVADALDELVMNEIDEVGASRRRRWSERRRGSALARWPRRRRWPGLDHGIEHHVAAGDGALRMAIGVEAAGALDHAGEESAQSCRAA